MALLVNQSAGDAPVLIVDDNPDVRRVLRMLLEDEGYRVCQAEHGREALTQIAAMSPALVLLDLNMPVMTGWQVLDELRTRRQRVPVVVMSAGRTSQTDAKLPGVSAWLEKPFDLDVVVETVQRYANPLPV